MNDKARQSVLEHKDISTTNDIYTDRTEELMWNEFSKYEKFLEDNVHTTYYNKTYNKTPSRLN